ncbi:MAG: hypothetical protein P8Z30_08970 [Acidobacteriota bacterium]
MHAEKCSSCRSLLDDLESIRSVAGELPLESPPPRVWSNVRANLAQEGFFRDQESFWRRWFGQASLLTGAAPVAALALALVLAVILIFRGDIQKNVSPSTSPPPVTTAIAPVGLTSVQANLVHTVQQMEENYRAREGSLDPSAKQIYQRGLDSLNSSIHECLDSLQKQPNNMLVREYLMKAYAQKAEVLASALEYGGR